MVHFVKSKESQLFDLMFEEEALQKDLSPSPAHPFLFLAGMGGAGYSCPATGGEDCGSAGCWGGWEDSLVLGSQEANTSPGVPQKAGSSVCIMGSTC